MRRLERTLVGLLALALVGPATAQVNTADAQKKALSKRAAEADAYRKLAECVKGLQITSDTYVKDFVAESDAIRGAMDEFIRGVRLGQPKWFADGSCEVPGEVTVQKVIETLKEVHTRFYKGHKIKGSDFNDMEKRIEKKIIKVVGMGAPRPDLPPDLPQGVAEQLKAPPVPPDPPLPELWLKIGPQARLMAKQAAELDAKRKLLERINGLRITSDTIVRDFVAQSDEIKAQANGVVVGAEIVQVYWHHDEPIVEVTVAAPAESVVTFIKELHTRQIHGDHVKGTDVSEVTKSINTKTFQATGMGIPPQKYIDAYARTASSQVMLPPWAGRTIEASGEGVPPEGKGGTAQGRLMAARAAELDAKRRLAENVYGLSISSQTSVKDFIAQHDDIRSYMDALLVGSSVEKTEYSGETAKVTVAIPGMQIWQVISQQTRIESAAR
jgi:hypothetical protein